MIRKFALGAGGVAAGLLSSGVAMAQDAPLQAPAAAAAATVDKGDTAWMMTATILVLMMILPGLALFYGGLTRTKNMLATMTQVGAVAALAMLVWVMWGYGMAFGPEGNAVVSWGKFFLAGVTPDSTAATFTDGVEIPEYVFVCFQMTFAAITVALVLGSVVERMKFSAVMAFALVWLTLVYFPIAHMVWASGGFLFEGGMFGSDLPAALDFAGGTVVHINAGPFGAIVLGGFASVACFYAVSKLKPALGYDDALDAFGIHGVGGMVGAIGTGVVYAPLFGGPGDGSVGIGAQVATQMVAVLVSVVWAAVGTAIAIFVAKALTGLRVSEEVEREGLDLGEHGERAYNY